jgi:hypothetical protein
MSVVPPLPLVGSRVARPKCTKNDAEDRIFKENIFYAVGARVMNVSVVIACLGGGGWSVCVPLPLIRSLVVRQNARKNCWLGPRTRLHSPHALPPPPPQRQISKKDRNIEANL